MARRNRVKTKRIRSAAAYVPHVDATPERLAKGDDSDFINPAEIDPREQPIGRVRRFRSTMLDRLHKKGQLTWPQWYAGECYRNAHARAALAPAVTAAYGERTTVGECSYGLARTEAQVRARQFVRECREQIPFDMRGFMDRLLVHDDLPRYGGRRYYRSLAQIRDTLDTLAGYMRICS